MEGPDQELQTVQPSQPTNTEIQQKKTEQIVEEFYNQMREIYPDEKDLFRVERNYHEYYLMSSLSNLNTKIRYYDTGHPWILYWITHSLELLGEDNFEISLQQKIVKFLRYCQHQEGGYCGGHGQGQQLASTYAAILSLMIVGSEEAYESIDRPKLYNFFLQIKNKDGSFRMSQRGETDLRGSYIVVILSKLLHIDTPELLENVYEYIARCQTYEGGLGPEPFSEAHGGLTFCGLAALCVGQKLHLIDRQKAIHWLTNRQMSQEGGFQGRTNKLVDNCYSFWQGASFRLLCDATQGIMSFNNKLLYDEVKLQTYILICQDRIGGGLFDKPRKSADLYHTCYTLSGLSLAQERADRQSHFILGEQDDSDSKTHSSEEDDYVQVHENRLFDIDPIYNIGVEKVERARLYFSNKN